jgi:hypothetical protein
LTLKRAEVVDVEVAAALARKAHLL